MSRARRIALWIALSLAALLLAFVVTAVFVVRSDWFYEKVRERIITEVERATGGRVELTSFHFDWTRLRATARSLTLHGKERPDQDPLFRTASLEAGLKIVSILKKDVDIDSLVLDGAEFHVYVAADGSTNFPEPAFQRKSDRHIIERFVDLAIRHFELRNGVFEYDGRRIPLSIKAEKLRLEMSHELLANRYQGAVSTERLWASSGNVLLPVDFGATGEFALERNRVIISRGRLTKNSSWAEATGTVEDFRNPRAGFDVKSSLALADFGKPLRIPIEHTGRMEFTGRFQAGGGQPVQLAGRATGSGLAYRDRRLHVSGMRMSSAVRLTRAGADLDDLTVYALGGRFDGRAEVPEFRRFHAAGRLTGVSIEALNRIEGAPRLAWSGAASGPISVEGSFRRDARDIRAQGQLAIVPKAGATPIQGQLQIAYDQRTGELSLGDSQLTLGSTRAVFRGAFGQTLCVSVRSRNLKDLLPAIGLFDPTPPASLPVDIVDGVASFEGMIQGPVQSPRITGKVTATNLVVANRRFDRFVSAVDVGVSGARLTGITLEQNAARLTGTASIGLRDWKTAPDSPISAEVKLERGDLAALIRESGTAVPVKGALSGTLQVSGTWGEPVAIAKATVDKFAVYDEQFDRLRAEIRYRGAEVEIVSGNAVLGDARLEFSGAYDHPANDWKNGLIRFQASSAGVDLRQVRSLARFRTDLAGNVQLKAAGSARVIDGAGRLTSLDGRIAVTKLVIDKKPTGDILVNAESRGDTLTLAVTGDLRGSKVTGKGEWRLVDGYPGGADVQFSRIEFSTLADLLPGDHAAIPAAGYIEGRVSIAGPALKPEALEGTVELTALEVAPVPSRLPAAVQGRDLSLHNDGPIVLDVDGNAVRVRSAQLIGDETRLTASGSVSYRAKTPWDLRVEGSLNLAVLRSFRPDILTGGSSTVDARVRGTLDRPQLFGSVDLKNASFFLENVPNGIENANGRIFFDNNRATIQSLTAETGGGAVTAGGFVGFGGEETAYRLNFKLDRVRVRYPEGVSTTVNASIGLNGTSANSLMTGTVSIVRLGFNPRSDLGSLLAESAKPISTPNVPSPFLQGMQFDVRIETAPNVEFQTALTQDIQAEADLRLRGSGTRPVVLGHVSVNQGEINFFGTKYAINHGEISFFNPVKIEPVLDLDLETKVRAVEVTIHIAGPINKLNVSYRSDPPLQSNEIIALLAVGRAPDPASLAAGQTVQSQTFLDTGANTLLGQAIAAPVSSRLQRFFGVSRLKIDPQLTTLENTPQARLTLEQQISRDITLTYITNLANAQQQIVRIEWNINRSWSVVAVREENGIFGVDFLYKKRFK